LATIQNQFDTINQEITAIEQEISGGGSSASLQKQIDDLSASLSTLKDVVSKHVAALVVHGTQSDVVGQFDAQQLDRKTIGLAIPGYGRFQPTVGSNLIPFGTFVVIGATDFMIGTGNLIVAGNLRVDGKALWL
jgi:hypothetical protein